MVAHLAVGVIPDVVEEGDVAAAGEDVGQLGEVRGRCLSFCLPQAFPWTGPGHAGGAGHRVKLHLVAPAEDPALQRVGEALQGLGPQDHVTGAGQQLPAAAGVAVPPAAVAVPPDRASARIWQMARKEASFLAYLVATALHCLKYRNAFSTK